LRDASGKDSSEEGIEDRAHCGDPVTRKAGTADANNINFWAANGVVSPDSTFAVNGARGPGWQLPRTSSPESSAMPLALP
jgi:hypothetical protein